MWSVQLEAEVTALETSAYSVAVIWDPNIRTLMADAQYQEAMKQIKLKLGPFEQPTMNPAHRANVITFFRMCYNVIKNVWYSHQDGKLSDSWIDGRAITLQICIFVCLCIYSHLLRVKAILGLGLEASMIKRELFHDKGAIGPWMEDFGANVAMEALALDPTVKLNLYGFRTTECVLLWPVLANHMAKLVPSEDNPNVKVTRSQQVLDQACEAVSGYPILSLVYDHEAFVQ
jgi:hypothetical protein